MRQGQASSAQKRKGKKGVRGFAGQQGAFGGRDLGDIPARNLPAGPVVGTLSSLPTFLRVVLAYRFDLVSQVSAAESGPVAEGRLQPKRYGVSSLRFWL